MDHISHLVLPKDEKIPPRFYHYTSQQGLIGILSSRALWSTRIQYLNDSTEFRYTAGLLQKAIQIRRESVEFTKPKLNVKKILDALANLFQSLYSHHLYVACFSEDGDDLNLWRGYCSPGSNGFSIGLKQAQLIEAASRQGCFLAPCIYDPQKQSELVDHLVDGLFNRANSAKEEGLDTKGMGSDFFWDCLFLASVLKHPSFREEREWRIVTGPFRETQTQIGVRPGKIIPIPYFRFELVQPKEELDVSIVVGPTPEVELSIDSVRTLLRIHRCAGTIVSSTVPYREV